MNMQNILYLIIGMIIGALLIFFCLQIIPEKEDKLFLEDLDEPCDVYYPLVIEDYATDNIFYIDADYNIHQGEIPIILGNNQLCISFKYTNKDYTKEGQDAQ